MKNLELSDLENIFGGNYWIIAGKNIFYSVISVGLIALESIVVGILSGDAIEGKQLEDGRTL